MLLLGLAADDARADDEAPKAQDPLHSRRMAVGGLVAGGVGAGMAALGEGLLADGFRGTHTEPFEGLTRTFYGIELIGLGGSLLLTGIPLAMVGASDRDEQSGALSAGGIVLTTLSTEVLGFGGTLLAFDPHENRTAGFSLMGGGALGIVGGLVLWRVGDVRSHRGRSSAARPEIAMGPGCGFVSWAF